MHIPENYLSVSTSLVLTAAMVPVWRRAVKRVSREFPRERFSALGVGAAFAFLTMMFNIPLPGGTTGHAVGGTVLATLLGPEAACLALTITLAIQALLFGDGGVLAFGANCFNMAFLLPYSGYYSYVLLRRVLGVRSATTPDENARPLSLKDLIALGLASYLGINVAALAAGVEFGIQPLLFTDASGQALYCPYPLAVAVPAMALGHLTFFGLAEVIFSLGFYAFVARTAPNFATNGAFFPQLNETEEVEDTTESPEQDGQTSPRRKRFDAVYLLLAALIALAPLGLLAQGTAWGEWGVEEVAELAEDGAVLGYTPRGMQEGFQWIALLPDYAVAGVPDWCAYPLSALAGVAIAIILFKLSAFFLFSRRTM
ncbi:MAG: cobalt transporter CbiM [Planctomycetia bacterium]|nr:cobalt transporter CbiM [Planctomycetia bacterium]